MPAQSTRCTAKEQAIYLPPPENGVKRRDGFWGSRRGFWVLADLRVPAGVPFRHGPDTSDSDFGVRRLVAALPFSHGIFGNLRGETVNIPFQFQVKSAGQTNVVP